MTPPAGGPQESVTACGLHGSLRNVTPEQRAALIKHITDISTSVSVASRRGSLLALYHFTSLLQTGLPLPRNWKEDTFWRQLLLIGGDNKHCDAGVQASWVQVGGTLPPLVRALNDGQSLTYAAQKLKTVFFNNIWAPLGSRMARMCKVFLKQRRAIMPAPCGGKRKQPEQEVEAGTPAQPLLTVSKLAYAMETGEAEHLPADVARFVAWVRSRLFAASPVDATSPNDALHKPASADTVIDAAWAKRNLVRVYRFNFWLLRCFRHYEHRGLRLAPVVSVGRKFASLDKVVLFKALQQCNVISPQQAAACSDAEVMHATLSCHFSMPRPRAREWTLFIDSDGVSAHYHSVRACDGAARRACKAVVTARKGAGKAAKKAAEEATAARKAAGLPQLEAAEEAEQPKPKKRATRKPTLEAEDPIKALLVERSLAPEDVLIVGVDPGRVNIAYAAVRLPEEERVESWSLTARDYYRCSGVNTYSRLLQAWHAPRLAAWSQLGDLKSGNAADVLSYLSSVHEIEPGWWQEVLKRRRGRWRARMFASKRRTVDNFWVGVKANIAALAPDKTAVLAYGSATFSASGRGNLTVPTTGMYKAAARQLPVCMQAEYRTSQVSPCCHEQVHKVWRTSDAEGTHHYHHGERVPYKKDVASQVRGLLFCPKCSSFLNRDRVGALNIGDKLRRRMLGEPLLECFTWMRKAERKRRKAAAAHE